MTGEQGTGAPRRGGPWAYVLLALLVGAAAGVVWRTTTVLPGYTIAPDGTAALTEMALTHLFTAVSRYSQLALAGGLLLGVLAVAMLYRRSWRMVLWALVVPSVAGLVAWLVGIVGGTPVQERIAQASPGDVVPVDLALNTPVAVLLWPFAAVFVVLVWSSFAHDPDQVARRSGHRTDRRDPGPGQRDQVVGGDLDLQ